MSQATITVRIDENDKMDFDAFFTDANMAYVNKSVQELRAG